jgi:DNA modification methylase
MARKTNGSVRVASRPRTNGHKTNGRRTNGVVAEVVKIAADEGTVSPRNKLNDLTAKQWLPETVSVWSQRGLGKDHAEAAVERQHPAPFSFTDVSRLICFFTKSGQTVLDPFVGVGSTLKACAINGRKGIGIELNPRYVKLSKDRLRDELQLESESEPQTVLSGDARKVLKTLPDASVDFVVTSPPYWCILHKEDHKAKKERTDQELDTRYSNDPRDLGNIPSYEAFLDELTSILAESSRVLKPSKYMAVIVSDFRDKKRYHMFHADIAARLEERGLVLKGITILFQRHKGIYPYGYPAAFVPNIHHQYIVILQKQE